MMSSFLPFQARLAGCLLACLLFLLPICGCGGGDSSAINAGPVVSPPRTFDNMVFTLASDKSVYHSGEPVQLTFTVRNVGTDALTIIQVGCSRFDAIVSKDNHQVWQYSQVPVVCGDGIGVHQIKPGEQQAFTLTWTRRNQQDIPVPSGQYTVQSSIFNYHRGTVTPTETKVDANLASNPITVTPE